MSSHRLAISSLLSQQSELSRIPVSSERSHVESSPASSVYNDSGLDANSACASETEDDDSMAPPPLKKLRSDPPLVSSIWASALDALADAAEHVQADETRRQSSTSPTSTIRASSTSPSYEPSSSRISPIPTTLKSEPLSSDKLHLDMDVEVQADGDGDVDAQLLSLVGDEMKPSHLESPSPSTAPARPPVPLYSAPPVRAAAKRSGTGGKIGAIMPTITSAPVRKKAVAKPKDKDKDVAAPSKVAKKPANRGGARASVGRGGRAKGGATSSTAPNEGGIVRKSSSNKKKTLLVQAQENRARSLMQAQAQSGATQSSKAPPGSPSSHDRDGPDTMANEDRLYCFCKSKYDEDRIMIGCDRCDEWYHPTCVSLQDSDVDQVDIYICPNCHKQHPHLQTTRKTFCKRPGCEKSSRRQASKFCSDDCGILAMQMLIEEKPIDRDHLWELVKNSRKPEGVTTPAFSGTPVTQNESWDKRREYDKQHFDEEIDQVTQSRRELAQLIAISDMRNELITAACERNVKAAAEGRDECGWDSRLMWEGNEWEDGLKEGTLWEGYRQEERDGGTPFWCDESAECERHAGWQKLQKQDAERERGTQKAGMNRLAQLERDLRMHHDRAQNPEANRRAMDLKSDPSNIPSENPAAMNSVSTTKKSATTGLNSRKPVKPKLSGTDALANGFKTPPVKPKKKP